MEASVKHDRAERRKVLMSGKIISNSAAGANTDCVVRDVSDTGACLILGTAVGIPNEFDLVIEKDVAVRRCRVEWRSPSRLGVSFR
jgi:hypothetical protein